MECKPYRQKLKHIKESLKWQWLVQKNTRGKMSKANKINEVLKTLVIRVKL